MRAVVATNEMPVVHEPARAPLWWTDASALRRGLSIVVAAIVALAAVARTLLAARGWAVEATPSLALFGTAALNAVTGQTIVHELGLHASDRQLRHTAFVPPTREVRPMTELALIELAPFAQRSG
jgi:hypothetical protein